MNQSFRNDGTEAIWINAPMNDWFRINETSSVWVNGALDQKWIESMVRWINGWCSFEPAQQEHSTRSMSQWNQWVNGTMAQSSNESIERIKEPIGQWFANWCICRAEAIKEHGNGTVIQWTNSHSKTLEQKQSESMEFVKQKQSASKSMRSQAMILWLRSNETKWNWVNGAVDQRFVQLSICTAQAIDKHSYGTINNYARESTETMKQTYMNQRRGASMSQWNHWVSGTTAQSINTAMEWIIALIGPWFAHQCIGTAGASDKHTPWPHEAITRMNRKTLKHHSIESMVLWIYEARIRSNKSAIETRNNWSINRWSESMDQCIDASMTSKLGKISHSNFEFMEQWLQNDQHVRVQHHINGSMCQLHMKQWMQADAPMTQHIHEFKNQNHEPMNHRLFPQQWLHQLGDLIW